MKIRKSYDGANPELLYAEIRDFALKQGLELVDSKQETFTLPDESASFVSRGTLVFVCDKNDGNECLRVHIVGSAREKTKLMMDIDENSFQAEKLAALQEDIDFIFAEHEPEE